MKNYALKKSFKFCFLACFLSLKLFSAATLWETDPLVIREKINAKIFDIQAPAYQVHSSKDITIKHKDSSIPLRLYYPNALEKRPVILLIHGGGWLAGSIETHDNLARYLSTKTQALVISVGYQNSPEAKFPIPFNECYAALEWTFKEIEKYGGDCHKIALVGDSAGGNLAAAVSLYAKDNQGPPILAQVLINPATDLSEAGIQKPEKDDLDSFRWLAKQYVQENEDLFNPYISPLYANNLAGLPPTLITVGEKDALRESGEKYASRLKEEGVKTTLFCHMGVGHLGGDGARASKLSLETLKEVTRYLNEAFSHNFSVGLKN